MSGYEECWCPNCCGEIRRRATVASHVRHCINEQNVNDGASGSRDGDGHNSGISDDDGDCDADHDNDLVNDHDSGDQNHKLGLEDNQSDHENDNSDGGEPNPDDDIGGPVYDELLKFFLRTLKIKVKFGLSQNETLSQLQSVFELTHDERIPYKSWAHVLKKLEELGYKPAEKHKICMHRDHVTLVKNDPCPNCRRNPQECEDYYVLGLKNIVENIFASSESIKNHTSHWRNRHEWLNKECLEVPRKELWHGERFRELSYFWDPAQVTQLPEVCTLCQTIIPVAVINAGREEGDVNVRTVTCPNCLEEIDVSPRFLRGNPLNQAIIIHEDGFNAFKQKTYGCSAIHVTSACVNKNRRKETLQVYGFPPTSNMPEGVEHKFDAFLEPLVDELKHLYVYGTDVVIQEEINIGEYVVQPGTHTVHVIPLLCTADIKALQDMVLYASGGRLGCRRCLTVGTYVREKRHYYYSGFGERFRNRSPLRTVQYMLEHGERYDNAVTKADKQQIRLETGVSGVSILFQLYTLCGFDPIKDLVVDRMHLTFNLIKKEFRLYMWPEMNENADREVNDRDPAIGGLMVHEDFKERLKKVKWTTQQKASGVPSTKSLTDKLGGWKANDFVKLCNVSREVLAEIIPSKAYDCFMLACDVVKMVYGQFRVHNGWEDADINTLESVIWAHNIRAEEFYGTAYCSENVEYAVHLPEVVRRHSSPDNYSCEMYERVIRSHKRQTTNSKRLEPTYVERENIRQFLSIFEQKHGPASTLHNEEQEYDFQIDDYQDPKPVMLKEKSVGKATQLMKDLSTGNIPACVENAVENGVVVGSIKRKKVTPNQRDELRRLARSLNPQENVYVDNVNIAHKLLKWDCNGHLQQFEVGDTCVLSSREGDEEWIVTITTFILIGPVSGRYIIAVDCEFYVPGWNGRVVAVHPWTQTTQMVRRHYPRDRMQLSSQIKRKVIMYPEPSNVDNPSYHLCIDFECKDIKEPVVPFYPKEGDFIQIQGGNNETWYAKVLTSDHLTRRANVQWFDERRPGQFVLLQQEGFVVYASVKGQVMFRRRLSYYELLQAV